MYTAIVRLPVEILHTIFLSFVLVLTSTAVVQKGMCFNLFLSVSL